MSEKIAVLIQRFNDHIVQHADLNDKVEDLDSRIEKLLVNHVPHLQEEVKLIRQEIIWIKKIGWFGVTTNIAVWVYIIDQTINYIIK